MTAVTATSAQAATVNCTGTTIDGSVFYVNYGQSGCVVPISHKCAQVGSAAGSETADECADVTVTDNSSAAQLWGTGEFYCQGPSDKCDEMSVKVGVSVTNENGQSIASTAYSSTYVCTSGCPNGGRALVSTSHLGSGYDCYWVYSWDPKGESFIDGTDVSHTSASELDSNYGGNLQVCLTN